jgi:phage-related minor tail protein
VNEQFKGLDRQFKEVNRRIDENTSELKRVRKEFQAFHPTFQRGNYTLVATIVGAIMVLVIKGG